MEFGVSQQLEAVYLILSFLVEDRYMQIAFRRLSKKGFGNSWLKLKSAWQDQSMYYVTIPSFVYAEHVLFAAVHCYVLGLAEPEAQ